MLDLAEEEALSRAGILMRHCDPRRCLLAMRTPTLPPATTSNVLIVRGDVVVVIEPACPYPEQQEALETSLERLCVGDLRLGYLLLTHHHRDHWGHAPRLREKFGAKIVAHEESAVSLPFTVDEVLTNEDVSGWSIDLGGKRRIRAVHTPGHAPGHLAFWEELEGWMYVGDLLASEGSILIDPDDRGDMAIYLESLKLIRGMCEREVRSLIPSHGEAIVETKKMIDHYLAHRKMRENKIHTIITDAGKALDLDELLRKSYADTPQTLWPLARKSLRAHLQQLCDEGKVERRQEGNAVPCFSAQGVSSP